MLHGLTHGDNFEDVVVRGPLVARTRLQTSGRGLPILVASAARVLDGVLAVEAIDIIGVPSGFVGVGRVVGGEGALLVDVAVVVRTDNLVAVGGHIKRDGPILARGIHEVLVGLEGGITGSGRYVREVLAVVLDVVFAVVNNLCGEYVEAVVVLAAVFRDELAELFFEERTDHDIGHNGIDHLDGAGEVAGKDILLCGLVLGERQIVLNEGFGVLSVQVLVETDDELAALSHEFHHLEPRSDFCDEFGAFVGGEKGIGSVDHQVKLSEEGLQGCCVVGSGHLLLEVVGHSLEGHGFVGAAQAVGVLSEVHVVLAEHVEGFVVARHEVFDGALPRGVAVVGLHVPGVVGNAVKGKHRGFGIFHRIAGVTAEVVGNREVVAEGGAHQEVADAIVRHGIVEPNVRLAANTLVNPGHVALVNEVHNAVARPHYAHFGIERILEVAQVLAVVAGPRAVVFGGAHNERIYVVVLLHELVGHVVEQLGLLDTAGAFAEDVIEEDGERANAESVHGFEFLDHVHGVGLVPLDVEARVNGPDELHFVLVGFLYEFLHLVGLSGGIVLAPVVAVIRVVLRAVDIHVHLVGAVELKLADAVRLAPVVAIETFNHAALEDVGPVLNGHAVHLGLGENLLERLHGVEGAAAVVTSNHDGARLHAEVITLGLFGNLRCVGSNGFRTALSYIYMEVGIEGGLGEEGVECAHGIGICEVGTMQGAIAARTLCKGFRTPFDGLRNGRDGHLLGGKGQGQESH